MLEIKKNNYRKIINIIEVTKNKNIECKKKNIIILFNLAFFWKKFVYY